MSALLTTEPVPEGTDLVVTVGRDGRHLITRLYRASFGTWTKLDPEDAHSWDSPYYDMPAPALVERDRLSGYLALVTTGGEPIAGGTLGDLPERSILAVYTRGSDYPSIVQRIHREWWDMGTHWTEDSSETYADEEISTFFDRGMLLWRADLDSIPERPTKERPHPIAPKQVPRRLPTPESLRQQILEVIPAPAVSNDVRDWPADEADFHRNGYATDENPDGWRSFTHRAERLALMRREKVADSILDLLAQERLFS